jgi:hypothetical protein
VAGAWCATSATLSYIDSGRFAQITEQQRRTRECSSDAFAACEARGELGHLVLIPESAEAMSAMRKVRLPYGKPFYLTGEWLDFQSANLNGGKDQLNIGPTRFFLVRTIKREG